jgi:hypothetical protein
MYTAKSSPAVNASGDWVVTICLPYLVSRGHPVTGGPHMPGMTAVKRAAAVSANAPLLLASQT